VETPGVLRATLGDAILRAETAAIAALAIVMR
jgi:16S rRNA U1498 N3-methylase RsmE